ncbi:MAG: Tol-Pal system beta propeller repeat protein TolB [Nitrospirae bacterium GWC2_42_7]|nr:MAG: Tol-Pal system beta propeller repeat protein TolB [Nitrospirae bacterium GWC2_42_7]
MKKKFRVSSFEFRVKKLKKQKFLFLALLLFTIHCLLFTVAEAKVYIDITSPAFNKLPIAIYDLKGPSGKEISEIIRDDLIFTGLFMYIDKASYIETDSQPFNPKNWTPLGIEAVVKGSVTGENNLTVSIFLYDAFEGRQIFSKQYQAEKQLVRQLAHEIANDVYQALTGKPGVFRTRIAFVAEDEGEKGIHVMDWDGHRIKKLGLKGSLVLTPHWSSDGQKIIYSSERGRQWGIFMLDFMKMTERKIYSSKGTNIAGDFFPKNDSFVFSSTKGGTPDLYKFQIEEKKIVKLTSSYGIEVSPSVSPDGDHIAFVSDRGGSPQIYMMRSDGSETRRVTFEGSYNTSPSWSPSGDMLVFSGRRGGKNQILLVRPDGSEMTQLTQSGNNEDPSFSSDGRYIAFSSDRGGSKGIYIMRANGEAQKKITPAGMKAFGPRWSPN